MSRPELTWDLPGGRRLTLGRRTLIMAAVNVTPDSFSDGGLFYEPQRAVEHALELAEQGADILDIGGMSTRPGSEPVSPQEELQRVLPVIQRLAAACDKPISIDTYRASVAQAALEAGATIINDITALQGDPRMPELAARSGAGVVLMHMQGRPRDMQKNPTYQDVVAEVRDFLAQRAQAAQAAGVARRRIVLDPGIGFGKTFDHNLQLIKGLPALVELGYPVLVGASRKAFIGHLTGREDPLERLNGTIAVHVLAAALGAHIVRVHDAGPLREALAVSDAVMAQEV